MLRSPVASSRTMAQGAFLALGCVGFIASAPAMAAAPTDAEEDMSATLVVTATRDEGRTAKAVAPLLDTPRSLVVVDKQVIQDTGSATLVDALRTLPGITFGAAAASFGTDNFKRLTGDVNAKLNDFVAVRVAGVWHDQNVTGRDALFQDRWGIAPSIRIGGKGPNSLVLGYYHLTNHEQPDDSQGNVYGTNAASPATAGGYIWRRATSRYGTVATLTNQPDLSATLFFAEPERHEGGELVIADQPGTKLAAGDLLLYPASTLPRVEPVRSGARVAAIFWIQSMVRDESDRTMLFDLDTAIQSLPRDGRDTEALVRLTGVYHNLLRHWAEV